MLIVGIIVRIAQGIPSIDLRHKTVEPFRVAESHLGCPLAVAYRHELVGESVIFQIFLDAHIQVPAHIQHMQRSVPIVVGKEIQHKEFRLGNIVLAFGNGEDYAVRNLVNVFLIEYAVFDDIFLVHRNGELARADIVDTLAGLELKLCARLLEHPHDILQRQNGIP